MARIVRWSRQAEDDLNEARDFIAQDSRAYARAFVVDVLAASRRLTEFSHLGHEVSEIDVTGLRELAVRGYRMIYYVTDDDEISIVGLIHGARDLGRAWRDKSGGGE